MKKALRKNFYMEIRHSLGRFLSIFFIVAIGCAFFSGIRASEPDMRYSGDAYFDEKNLMDIQVMSTMGLTEDDLDAIRAVDGVLDAEGSYATDVLCTIRGNQVAVHVMALQNKMNQVQLEDGRLPEKENECVIDADYLDGKNLKIGDKITLSSGTSDSLEDTLKTDTFTIVGTVSSPEYIAFHRGSTTIGNGSVSAFLCVPEKAFSLDVYTEITVQVEGAKEATAFTKEYEEHVDSVLKKVQAIKAEREQARYDEITSTAQEKVDEAQEELAQAEQDLADGKEEAEEELATLPQLATEDMFITEHYFIETSIYGNAIIPIDQIIWIYKYSTLHKFFWYHFSISYTLHISANKHLYIQCPKNIKSDIDGIIDYLSEANHDILVGFNEKNRLKVQEIQGTPMHFEKFIAFLNKRV